MIIFNYLYKMTTILINDFSTPIFLRYLFSLFPNLFLFSSFFIQQVST